MCKVEAFIYAGGVVLCPKCLGHEVAKGGQLKGRQRFKCKAEDCGRVFVANAPRQLVDILIRQAARVAACKLAGDGISVPLISKASGIPVRTIYHDIKLDAAD